MSIAYINKTIPLPKIASQVVERQKIADGGETADGTYREDVVAVKKTWRLDTTLTPYTEYKAIIDYLDSILWGESWFWIDEFGGSPETHSIRAFFDPGNDTRSPHGNASGWDNKGRQFGIVVRSKH